MAKCFLITVLDFLNYVCIFYQEESLLDLTGLSYGNTPESLIRSHTYAGRLNSHHKFKSLTFVILTNTTVKVNYPSLSPVMSKVHTSGFAVYGQFRHSKQRVYPTPFAKVSRIILSASMALLSHEFFLAQDLQRFEIPESARDSVNAVSILLANS